MLIASHCLFGFFYQPAPLSGLWVSAGSDHDLRHIFCNKFSDQFGLRMCDFKAAHNYTKKVVKLHMHPRYSPVTPVKYNSWLRENIYDIALLEVQPFTLSEQLNILPGCLFESNDYSFGDRLLAAGLV